MGKTLHLFIPGKTAALAPALAVKDLPLVGIVWWLYIYIYKFLWNPEGPVSQILSSPPWWCPWELLRYFKAYSDAKERERERECGVESNGKLPHLSIPNKTATSFPEFAVEDMPLAELQPWFLRLQWKTSPWAELYDGDDIFHCTKEVMEVPCWIFLPFTGWIHHRLRIFWPSSDDKSYHLYNLLQFPRFS